MTSPLESAIAKAVYSGAKSLFFDATLARDTLTTGSPDVSFDPAGVTTTTYTCKAIRDNPSKYEMSSGLVRTDQVKILILANSLSVTPRTQDRVTIQSETFTIDTVNGDPANALWTCTAKK